MPPRIRSIAAAALAAAVATLAPAPAAAADESPYAGGEKVTVTGRVTDAAGQPLAGVTVALEASRAAWSFRRLGKVRKEATRIRTTTGDDGGYSLVWPWHEFYNRFYLIVGLEVVDRHGRRLREVQRTDVSRAMLGGSPVAAPVTVEDAAFIRDYQAFVAAIDSDAKRQVFDEAGRPGRIDRNELAGRVEDTWWYFRLGKAYRFEDGRLAQVIEFEPVTSF